MLVADVASFAGVPSRKMQEIWAAFRGAVKCLGEWVNIVKKDREEMERENHSHLLLAAMDNRVFAILKGMLVSIPQVKMYHGIIDINPLIQNLNITELIENRGNIGNVDPSLTTADQLIQLATLATTSFPDHVGTVELRHVTKAAEARKTFLTRSCRRVDAVYPPVLVQEAKCYNGSAGSCLLPEDREIPEGKRPFEVKKFNRNKTQVQ